MEKMPILEFDSALSRSRVLPKSVKVSTRLWNALKDANLITRQHDPALAISDPGFTLPFYRGIYLVIDPDIEQVGQNFVLPSAKRADEAPGMSKPLEAKHKLAPEDTVPIEKGYRSESRWLGRS
jgi:hypothetical protein